MDMQKSPRKKWIALIIIIVILGGLIAFLLSKKSLKEEGEEVFSGETESVSSLNEVTLPVKNSEEQKIPSDSAVPKENTLPVSSIPDLAETNTTQKNLYKDGTYTASGNYVSPGGAEAIGVTLSVKENTVTDVQIEVKAGIPTSKNWQTIFSKNVSAVVVGKKMDEINLDVVSGSSLTPVGFMDALSKMKVDAKT